MQKAYSGWELQACSGSHGSFPAVPTWFPGEGLHHGVVTHGVCLSAGSGDWRSFQGELPSAGCRWWLWPEEGMDCPCAQPAAPGDVPVPQHSPCHKQRLWERQVWGNGEGVCSQTLQVLKLVCGGRVVISIRHYLNVSTLRIISVF